MFGPDLAGREYEEPMMTLPLSDSALIGTCLAASALGLLVMTSGGNGSTPAPAPVESSLAVEEGSAAPAATDILAELGATPLAAPQSVDADFGAQVRAYLLQNPEVIFEAVAAYEQRTAEAQVDMDRAILEANAEALFNDGHSWVGGNTDGDVTLVEFIDYRCGFCKRAHEEVAALLEADSGIRLILKEFPILGPESELASRFAVAALRLGGDTVYEVVQDSLMRHDDAITREFLEELAAEQGLDFVQVGAEMESEAVTDILMENRALAQRLQISGTPTFVMETELIRGFVPADVLIEIAESLRE
jgi:protein-disulfide isomerase